MNKKFYILLLTLFLFNLPYNYLHTKSIKNHRNQLSPLVIYGEDNRWDFFEISDLELQKRLNSTVALFRDTKMTFLRNNTYQLHGETLEEKWNICPTEPFSDQPTGPYCTGLLVDTDKIMTAKHCFRNIKCSQTNFVFGFHVKEENNYPKEIHKKDVYFCKKIIYSSKVQDIAIIQLDRYVQNYEPLPIERNKNVLKQGDSVFMTGYPLELPVKLSTDGVVRNKISSNKQVFITNLDAFSGNSGSPVFNSKTGNVEGLLSLGDKDFHWNEHKKCNENFFCKTDQCVGELITVITEDFFEFLSP